MGLDYLDIICDEFVRFVDDYYKYVEQYQKIKKRLINDPGEYSPEEIEEEIDYFLLRIKRTIDYGFGFKRRINHLSNEDMNRLKTMKPYIELIRVLSTHPRFLSMWT